MKLLSGILQNIEVLIAQLSNWLCLEIWENCVIYFLPHFIDIARLLECLL